MRILLISTYDLGRQPFGLASPAAWLRRAGLAVDCVDASRQTLEDSHIHAAALVAFYLPMHTATRLAVPLIERVARVNPAAAIAAYGLYAPLNAAWLRRRGVSHVLGPECEAALTDLATACVRFAAPGSVDAPGAPGVASGSAGLEAGAAAGEPPVAAGARGRDEAQPRPRDPDIARLAFIRPDRHGLPPLERYASLQMPDGTRRVAGSTEATRGCKHLCRHCPIVPVYRGAFRVVPVEVVLADISAQVAAGAQHISFGDPDFFNGPTHARRVVERLAAEHPGVTYDVTIKIEHLLAHAGLLPLLRDTGCLFVTSAVESLDDDVLAKLRKGHSRDDVVRAVAACREAGVELSPTFVPFTPWTTIEGYVDLLETLASLELVHAVAPIQLAIRLLVTADSALLELPDVRATVGPFDAAALAWPWRHRDARVDALQSDVMALVGAMAGAPRARVYDAIASVSRRVLGSDPGTGPHRGLTPPPPHMTEAWYCCAEPVTIGSSGGACAGEVRPPAPGAAPLDYV